MAFPVPANEAARLAALRDLDILDTGPEPLYDDVVALAAAICGVPIALINLVDADRQWGKALIGLASSEAPREASFCARTIVAEDGILVVPDTHADPLWSGNAQVLGEPFLRFYAGASIVTEEGHALGSVCVADRDPREIGAAQLDALRALARQTAAHLALRKRSAELQEANAELRRMAVQDALTGIANRTLLTDRLGHALHQRRRSGRDLGVLFADLDGFKQINDRLGHHAGDEVLCAVAKRLAGAARLTDTVARFAGDEFVVVCPDLAAPEDLGLVIARLEAAVALPLDLGAETIEPQLSIGATLAGDTDYPHDVLRRADEAMYAVKRARRLGLAGAITAS